MAADTSLDGGTQGWGSPVLPHHFHGCARAPVVAAVGDSDVAVAAGAAPSLAVPYQNPSVVEQSHPWAGLGLGLVSLQPRYRWPSPRRRWEMGFCDVATQGLPAAALVLL